MLWYKRGRNAGEINLAYNNMFHVHDMLSSSFKSEPLLPTHMLSMVKVKAISVLQSGVNNCIIGVEGDGFSERFTKLASRDVVQRLLFRRDYIAWFSRSFKVEGVSCVQGVFLYNEVSDLDNILSQLGI